MIGVLEIEQSGDGSRHATRGAREEQRTDDNPGQPCAIPGLPLLFGFFVARVVPGASRHPSFPWWSRILPVKMTAYGLERALVVLCRPRRVVHVLYRARLAPRLLRRTMPDVHCDPVELPSGSLATGPPHPRGSVGAPRRNCGCRRSGGFSGLDVILRAGAEARYRGNSRIERREIPGGGPAWSAPLWQRCSPQKEAALDWTSSAGHYRRDGWRPGRPRRTRPVRRECTWVTRRPLAAADRSRSRGPG